LYALSVGLKATTLDFGNIAGLCVRKAKLCVNVLEKLLFLRGSLAEIQATGL